MEKIQLKSIKLESLNGECLLAVNRCVRYIKQNHGQALRLQDREILVQISNAVRVINDPELSLIYKDLKQKMAVCVNKLRAD